MGHLPTRVDLERLSALLRIIEDCGNIQIEHHSHAVRTEGSREPVRLRLRVVEVVFRKKIRRRVHGRGITLCLFHNRGFVSQVKWDALAMQCSPSVPLDGLAREQPR